MTNALLKSGTVGSALLSGCLAWSGASASDREDTAASVTIVPAAAVTVTTIVVSNAPLQTFLLTAALAPMGVVFTAPGPGSAAIGTATGGGNDGLGTNSPGGGPTGADGTAPAGLFAAAGSFTGTTLAGDAVSVSVGSVSSGSSPGSASVSVVIAQYN